jgi:hypothetical protein
MSVEHSGTRADSERATAAPQTRAWWGAPREFVLALAALGLTLTVTVIPSAFTMDELNYLVNVIGLRQGHVTVPNTAGLSPSSELTFFDPAEEMRVVTRTPVGSTAPPLYGLLALPFVSLGWRGLVAINTVCYLVTALMVFVHVRRAVNDEIAPWLAAAAFALGGFTIEYAQGLWPHGLSIALCTGGVLLVARATEGDDRIRIPVTAGLLLAAATGIRYQNAVVLGAAGAGLFFWSGRRWRASVAYGTAALVPLAISAAINHARLGWWNPISKGPGYLSIPIAGAGGSPFDPIVMLWSRLVDFSMRPPLLGDRYTWVKYEPVSGAHLMFGTAAQKAFLQSAPWAVLAFLCFVLIWFNRAVIAERLRGHVRLFSLVAIALLLAFSASGRWRHEGASYNQRYLLELVPLAAITFGWVLAEFRLRAKNILTGALWGALLAVVVLVTLPLTPVRLIALFKVPLALAVLLAVAWWLARRRGSTVFLGMAAGACLGWACLLHLGDDLIASRLIRAGRLQRTEALRRTLPDHSALIAYWGTQDAVAPLLLEKDIVVLDAHNDGGEAAPALARELLARNRRVFVLKEGMPGDVLSRVTDGLMLLDKQASLIAELVMSPPPAPRETATADHHNDSSQ